MTAQFACRVNLLWFLHRYLWAGMESSPGCFLLKRQFCSFWIYAKFSSAWLISSNFPINLSNCHHLGILLLMLLTPVVLVFLSCFLFVCPRRAFLVFASCLLPELSVCWFLCHPESLFLDNTLFDFQLYYALRFACLHVCLLYLSFKKNCYLCCLALSDYRIIGLGT